MISILTPWLFTYLLGVYPSLTPAKMLYIDLRVDFYYLSARGCLNRKINPTQLIYWWGVGIEGIGGNEAIALD